MLNEFIKFRASFIEYIKDGSLPQGFETLDALKSYIQDELSDQERYQLWSFYYLELAPKTSWSYAGPVLEFAPRAVVEGILCSVVSMGVAYKMTEDLTKTLGSASLGLLWTYGRCQAKSRAVHALLDSYESRVQQFNLPRTQPQTSNLDTKERVFSASVNTGSKPLLTLAEKINAKRTKPTH